MPDDQQDQDYPSPAYSWYVVGVLTLAYVFSFIDRQILSLLVKPIRRDLEISDTQMSLLMGASFAIFYTLFGIPLGRLADTKSRRAIVAVGIAFWSIMTAGCGVTKKYWELLLMRMGVGVGEATLSPAAYSMIADYFPPERRSTAMSVYSMGIYIGSGLAFILGGLVVVFASNQESFELPLLGAVRSWQLVFFLVGLPGLLVALLVFATVREPVRKGLSRTAGAAPPTTSLEETWKYVSDNSLTFLCLNLGIALITLNSYASAAWIPSLFSRRFGWTPGPTGMTYGTIVAIAGTLGTVMGGWLADRWNARGQRDANVRVAWLATICWIPFGLAFPLAPNAGLAVVLLIPTVFFLSMPFGVAPAAIQRMMPNTMRAFATAIYFFVINIIGMGLGPTAAAALTEHVFQDENSLHHSLLVVGAVTHVLAAILLTISLSNYRRSLDYLTNWSAANSAGSTPS